MFFISVMNYYTLPLHIVRDLFMTFQQFVRRVRDFQLARQATRAIDRLAEATPEDLAAGDPTCIFCREEITLPGQHAKK